MPIECKVSNSATKSIKRLNNDAAVKAVSWRTDLGAANVVPPAVLSGVYKLRNLIDAQEKGLTPLFGRGECARLDRAHAPLSVNAREIDLYDRGRPSNRLRAARSVC